MGNWVNVDEVIKERMLRDRNNSRLDMPMYLSYAKRALREMKLHNVRQLSRRWVNVNTDLNRFKLPDDVYMLATITYEDTCGLKLFAHNSTIIHSDIVDINEADMCGCKCGCNNENCKKREFSQIIEEVDVKVPVKRVAPILESGTDDSSCVECEPNADGENAVIDDEMFEYEIQKMEKTTRTEICENGDVIKTTITPTVIYKRVMLAPIENCQCDNCAKGEPCSLNYRIAYSGIEDREEKNLICSVDVKNCGCIGEEQMEVVSKALGYDTTDNKSASDNCCGRMTTCCPTLDENVHIVDGCMVYIKNELCINPKRVLITYYTNEHYTDMKIPDWAVEYLLASVKYFMVCDDDKSAEYFVRRMRQSMLREKDLLRDLIFKFTFSEFSKSLRFGNRYKM